MESAVQKLTGDRLQSILNIMLEYFNFAFILSAGNIGTDNEKPSIL